MANSSSRLAVVTGASGALGGAMVSVFLESGFRVVGLDRAESGGAVETLRADLADSADVRRSLGALRAKHGPVDCVVHCAGGFRFAAIEDTSDQDFDFLMSANLKSAFFLLREALPEMKRRGWGRVVLIGSRATSSPPAGMSAYCAAKAGVNALVAAATEETRGLNVTVNALLPSVIDTPANRRDMPKADFSTWVPPESLARWAVRLCSPGEGDAVRGALIPVVGRV